MNTEQIQNWIESGPTSSLIQAAEGFGSELAGGRDALTTSQIRQVFTRLKNIESKGLNTERLGDLLMLKPFIAYAAGRHKKVGVTRLKDMVCEGIDHVAASEEGELQGRFRNFVKLFEAVLAYHRAAGGN